MNVPDWATIDSDFELNYLVNINSDKDFNCHYLREDRVAVIRECNTDGTLCDLRQKKDDTQPWTLLEIKTFRDNGIEFNIPVCKKCSPVIGNLSRIQNKASLTSQLCHHARVMTNIVRDYDNPYYMNNWLELSDEIENGSKIEIIHKKENTSCSSHHLAVAFDQNKIGILWTQGRMITPTCTLCSSKKCKHYHQWHNKFEGTKKSDEKGDGKGDLQR